MAEPSMSNVLAEIERRRKATSSIRPSSFGEGWQKFKDRAVVSLETDVEAQRDILDSRGIPKQYTKVEDGVLKVQINDPSTGDPNAKRWVDFDEKEGTIYDFADWVGDLIPMAVQGVATRIPFVGQTTIGQGAAAAGGDFIRQHMAEGAGSKRPYDYTQTGIEGAVGGGAEKAQKWLGKMFKGPLSDRAGQSDEVADMMGDVRAVDEKFGTNLEETIPAGARTGDEWVGALEAEMRQNPATSGVLKEAESKFYRIQKEILDKIGRKGGEVKYGPKRDALERAELSEEAFDKTTDARQQQINKLYNDFYKVVDRNSPVDRTLIDEALANPQLLRYLEKIASGQKISMSGQVDLTDAVTLAKNAKTYDEVQEASKDVWNAITDDRGRADPLFSTDIRKQIQNLGNALHRTEMNFLRSGGGTDNPEAYKLGRAAADAAADLFKLNKSGAVRSANKNPEQFSRLSHRLINNMTAEEVLAVKRAIGKEGTSGGLEMTDEGATAWAHVMNDFFTDLFRAGSVESGQMRRGPLGKGLERVISGPKILSHLDSLEKGRPGSVEALIGPDLLGDIRQFAEMITKTTLSERSMGNPSGTSRLTNLKSGYLADILEVFTGLYKGKSERGPHPSLEALSRLTARAFMDKAGAQLITHPGFTKAMFGQNPIQKGFARSPMMENIGRGVTNIGARIARDDYMDAQNTR